MNLIRILHLEDSRSDCIVVAETLADTLRGAWQLTQVPRLDHADVILLDLGLPDSKDEATLAAIGAAAPNTPIVILTGRDDAAFAAALIRAGANDSVSKRPTWRSRRSRSSSSPRRKRKKT